MNQDINQTNCWWMISGYCGWCRDSWNKPIQNSLKWCIYAHLRYFEKQVKKDDLIFCFVFMSNKIGYNCVFPRKTWVKNSR